MGSHWTTTHFHPPNHPPTHPPIHPPILLHMYMRIIRMHCPSQSAQAEPIWRGSARHLYSLITMDAQFGPLDLPDGEGILSKKQTNKISQPTGCKAAVKVCPQWGDRKLSNAGPLERLQKILVNNAAYDASKAAPRTPFVRPQRGTEFPRWEKNWQQQAPNNWQQTWCCIWYPAPPPTQQAPSPEHFRDATNESSSSSSGLPAQKTNQPKSASASDEPAAAANSLPVQTLSSTIEKTKTPVKYLAPTSNSPPPAPQTTSQSLAPMPPAPTSVRCSSEPAFLKFQYPDASVFVVSFGGGQLGLNASASDFTVKDRAILKSKGAELTDSPIFIGTASAACAAEPAELAEAEPAELAEASRASRAAQAARSQYYGLLNLQSKSQMGRRSVDAATQTSNTNLRECPRCKRHFAISDLMAARMWGASSCIFPPCDHFVVSQFQ